MMSDLRRILLVEDNPNDVELTIEALKEHNLANAVDLARDGEEALDYLHRRGPFSSRPDKPPVVILLDLKLPKINGLEVLKEIKSDNLLRVIPVIVLTSSRQESDLAESYKLGVNSYVVKPVNYHDFIDAVRTLGMFWALINEPPPVASA